MKVLPLLAPILLASAAPALAANLMLDLGATAAAEPYLTLSPGHASGWVPANQTSWNTINTSASRNNLIFSDGTAATGVILTLGQEATGGNNIISYSTAVSNLGLTGSGGSSGPQPLLTAGSIYGPDTSSTASGRDGIFGGGTATGAGAAIGLRVDGLVAGDYLIYVMARNTNTNVNGVPMNVFTTTGASSGTFDFSALTAAQQSNPTYLSGDYVNQYGTFINGENHVAIPFSISENQSLYVAIDGAEASIERRGFLNMVQVVPIPEPSTALLGLGGLLAFLRRRR